MTKQQYFLEHSKLADAVKLEEITWVEFRAKMKDLDENHEHDYQKDKTGERVCWCGAIQ